MLDAVPLIAALLVFAFGAMTDLVSYRIPNWISLAAIGLFAVSAALSGMTLGDFGVHFLVGFAALAVGFALFALGIIGGGDAKFFAAGALWMGPVFILKYCLIFALVGGGFAVLLLVLRLPAIAAALSCIPYSAQLLNPKAGLPYGVALGIGAMIVLPATPIFIHSFHT